jgi:ABC-type glycerol-3-phosphate transport system substrate-binding protein
MTMSRTEAERQEALTRELAGGLTRRTFLRRASAALAFGAAGGNLLAACGGGDDEAAAPAGGGGDAEQGGDLTVWFLTGGLDAEADRKWYQDTGKAFADERGANVKMVSQTLENFITAWKSAVAAGSGPDLQYLWEGIYTLEDAWRGTLVPHSDYLPEDEIDHWLGIASVRWDGSVWNSPHDLSSLGFVYNGALFQQAGLDPDEPLETWDQLLSAADKLKAAGITPFGFGIKDGFGGGWLYSAWAKAHLDNVADEMRAVVGEEDIADEKHSEWWFRLAELRDKGFFNDDIGSLGLFDALNLFPQKKVAMMVSGISASGDWIEALGEENVKVQPIIPTFGEGELTQRNVTIFSGGLVIAKHSEAAQLGADFAAFMHQPQYVDGVFTQARGLPADDRFDTSLLPETYVRDVFEQLVENPGPWLEDWIPTQMDAEANFAGCQAIFAGESPEEQVERTKSVLEKWRRENPDLVEAYGKWIEDAENAYA